MKFDQAVNILRENYNEFDCPVCDEVVEVPLPYAKTVVCPNGHVLEIMPDAEFFDGFWHDRTELSPVEG